jgi:hypothetical protein
MVLAARPWSILKPPSHSLCEAPPLNNSSSYSVKHETVTPASNSVESAPAPSFAGHSFNAQLSRAFRGGALLVASSVLWGLFLPRPNNDLMVVGFAWLPAAWVVFPVGAYLGWALPRWVSGKGLGKAATLGIGLGISAGLFLALSFWAVVSHDELIGLITNHASQGYASYSYAVKQQLRERGWNCAISVVPVTVVWMIGWNLCQSRSISLGAARSAAEEPPSDIALGLDWRLVRVVSWMAVGLSIFALAMLSMVALLARGARVPLQSFPAVGFGALGLVLLGPFFGPMTTGWSFGWAWRYAAVALPVLLVALAPFARRRVVRPTTAVVAWCGFITALFFWIATGLFSLGRCLG